MTHCLSLPLFLYLPLSSCCNPSGVEPTEQLTASLACTDECLRTDFDISRCSYKLFASSIFAEHADYVRRQIIYGLLQEDDPNTLHLIAAFLLFDGRQNEVPLQMMNEEGAFARLLELIQALRRDEMGGGAGLHRLCMDLLYEMSRIQRVKIEDLGRLLHSCILILTG